MGYVTCTDSRQMMLGVWSIVEDFRKAHRKLLKKIFLIFSRVCREMKLMDAETQCLDGATVRAVNGKKQATSTELSRKKLEYAKAQLSLKRLLKLSSPIK